jgi:hypothetical protein
MQKIQLTGFIPPSLAGHSHVNCMPADCQDISLGSGMLPALGHIARYWSDQLSPEYAVAREPTLHTYLADDFQVEKLFSNLVPICLEPAHMFCKGPF